MSTAVRKTMGPVIPWLSASDIYLAGDNSSRSMRREEVAGTRLVSVMVEYETEYEQTAALGVA